MMDAQEFTELAKAHMDMIFRLAFSRLKSRADADDVTQNVLLALFQSDKVFESDAHLRHWLVRVILNECRKHWRSPWTRTEDIETYAVTLPFEDAHSEGLFRAIMALEKPLRTGRGASLLRRLYHCGAVRNAAHPTRHRGHTADAGAQETQGISEGGGLK